VSQQSYKAHEWPVLCGNLHQGLVEELTGKRRAGKETVIKENLMRAAMLL
jgi:hypothetical protein